MTTQFVAVPVPAQVEGEELTAKERLGTPSNIEPWFSTDETKAIYPASSADALTIPNQITSAMPLTAMRAWAVENGWESPITDEEV